MTLKARITVIDPNDVDHLVSEAAKEGASTYHFSTKGAIGRSSFFDAVRHALPLDPPIVGSRNWDALSDSLWSGLHEVNDNPVVIFWTDSSDFKNATSSDYSIVLEILKDIASSLADQTVTNGNPQAGLIFIGLCKTWRYSRASSSSPASGLLWPERR